MVTANSFVRKIGNMAMVITITDWKEFNELDGLAKNGNADPDYIVPTTISKTMYSGMQPAMQVNCYKGVDISEQTRGLGIAGILTEGFNNDACSVEFKDGDETKILSGIWAFKDLGQSLLEHMGS